MRNLLKNQKGFTLVELLAVIVILAIISAIAVPSIGHLISKTQDNAKVAEGVQIINAAKIYVQSESGNLSWTKDTTNKTKTATITATELKPYLSNLNKDANAVKGTGFSVTVTQKNDSTSVDNGKDTYTLVGHNDPVSNGGSATEGQLLGTTTP